MISQLIAIMTIGALVGAALGAFGTRNRRVLLRYVLVGVIGALCFAFLPYLRGYQYLNANPIGTVILSALFVGIAILFTSGNDRRL